MTEDSPANFGALLHGHRVAASLSQEALAERAGLSATAIAALERGRRTAPRPETVALLSEALQLSQTARAAFVAAATGQPAQASPSSPIPMIAPPIPVPPTALIGREREWATLIGLLRPEPGHDAARLLTLTGPGGVGKTRLALKVAAGLQGAYRDGVWLVELAALSDPALVPITVADLLGVREQQGQSLHASIAAHLHDKRVLLVLDNCEHLIEACAELAAALLPACPTLHVLATSREGLAVTGERRYPVPCLSTPDPRTLPPPDMLADFPSVALFVDRARQHRAEFTLNAQNAPAMAQICAQLDGIPLAIELAAARVGTLTVEAISLRLGDRFRLLTGGPRAAQPRQRTLQAALDWSYDLLSATEQTLLRRLAVFAGGWTLEAAELVCTGTGIAEWDVLDLLGQLINKSLARLEDREAHPRYTLLETVRHYAYEKLVVSGEAAVLADRHLDWCLALAALAEPALVGPELAIWLARLAVEHDNVRAALRWATEQEGAGPDRALETARRLDRGLQVAGALWRFWYVRGYLHEGRSWLEGLLARTDVTAGSPVVRAKAFRGAGVLALSQGDYPSAQSLCERSLTLYQELGDVQGVAVALNILGSVASNQGDLARAVALLEQSLALHRDLGATRGIAVALNNLGTALLAQGGYGRAAGLFTESLALNRELGDQRGCAVALNNLGDVARWQGDYARARALCVESLAIARELGDTWAISAALNQLGDVAFDQGDFLSATALYRDCLALRRELGDRSGIALLQLTLAQAAREVGSPDDAVAPYIESLDLYRIVGNSAGIAACLEGMAGLALQRGWAERAARYSGAAAGLRGVADVPIPPVGKAINAQTVEAVRTSLADPALAAAWESGYHAPREAILDAAVAWIARERTGVAP